MLDAKIFLNS